MITKIRDANAFLFKPPADLALGEVKALVEKGREALVQMKSLAFVDIQSIQRDDYPNFWMEVVSVIEGIQERLVQAIEVLQ